MLKEIEIKKNKIFCEDNILKENLEKSLFEIKEFIKGFQINCKIVFLTSRKEMDQVKGEKTQRWVAAFADHKKNIIYIFDEYNFEKETIHKKQEFLSTLKHELAHVVINQNFGFIQPLWLNEGIASVIANQKFKEKEKKDIREMHTLEEWKLNHSYSNAFNFTHFLINKFGKEKIVLFLKTLDRFEIKKNFSRKFNLFFKEEFDHLVQEWLKQ